MALLPFEPPYFERVGLACSYVGHPVLESGADRGDAARFRAAHGIAVDELLLSVLPGSRAGEVGRLLPVFGASLELLQQRLGRFRVVVPTVPNVAAAVAAGVRGWPQRPILVAEPEAKYDAFAASRAALAASGSVALELALARLPMVVGYRVSPLTEALLRRVLKVRSANLVNLILGEALVPELLGRGCTPERLAAALAEVVGDERVRAAHREGYDRAIGRLAVDGDAPSLRAADRVLDIVSQRTARS